MNSALRAFVRERAGRRCEYCRLHEEDADFLPFHVEHVVAKQHGGTDDPDTLCFACAECNWAKGPNVAGILGGKLYPLIQPAKTELETALPLGQHDPRRQDLFRQGHRASPEHQPAIARDARENLLFEGRIPARRIGLHPPDADLPLRAHQRMGLTAEHSIACSGLRLEL